MTDKRELDNVVFNNDVYVSKKEIDYDSKQRIIWVEYPLLRTWGYMCVFCGLFVAGMAWGYNWGAGELGLRATFYVGVMSFTIVILGLIMNYYSSDIYFRRDD
jgi:hypothetical protein